MQFYFQIFTELIFNISIKVFLIKVNQKKTNAITQNENKKVAEIILKKAARETRKIIKRLFFLKLQLITFSSHFLLASSSQELTKSLFPFSVLLPVVFYVWLSKGRISRLLTIANLKSSSILRHNSHIWITKSDTPCPNNFWDSSKLLTHYNVSL